MTVYTEGLYSVNFTLQSEDASDAFDDSAAHLGVKSLESEVRNAEPTNLVVQTNQKWKRFGLKQWRPVWPSRPQPNSAPEEPEEAIWRKLNSENLELLNLEFEICRVSFLRSKFQVESRAPLFESHLNFQFGSLQTLKWESLIKSNSNLAFDMSTSSKSVSKRLHSLAQATKRSLENRYFVRHKMASSC